MRKKDVVKFKKRRKGPDNRPGIILISVVIIIMGFVCAYRIHTIKKSQKEYDKKIEYYSELIADEEKRQEDIAEFEKYMQTDAYVEEIAKDRLGLVKDREIIFVAE